MATTLLPAELTSIQVQGRNLRPGTLRDQWGDRPTLLVFLRHLGCIFADEVLAEVRRAAAEIPGFPELIFIHPASLAEGEALFGAEFPEARAAADPEHALSSAFGIRRGSIAQMFGPGSIACGIRAFRNGHRQKKLAGDPRLMPGYRLVAGDRIVWSFDPSNIGETPDFGAVARAARDVAAV